MLSLAVLCSILIASSLALPICHSHTQSNPIARIYPNDATCVIKGTTAIVPIPYDVARQIVPAQYAILTSAYREVFPSLSPGLFPAVLEAVQDHDVKQLGIGIPDFTVRNSASSSRGSQRFRCSWKTAHGSQVPLCG